jgi:hypothetical protein
MVTKKDATKKNKTKKPTGTLDKKINTDKVTASNLLAIPSKSSNGTKLTKTKKETKAKISIDKLKTVYTILINDPLPDEDDEISERKAIISAIKKVLK